MEEWKQERFIRAYAAKKKFEAMTLTILRPAHMVKAKATTKTKMYPL
jgi:hypothetical protein